MGHKQVFGKHMYDPASGVTMPTLSNEELDKKIREIHNRFHGRLRTHEDVARRAKWTPEELDGVHIQDEHIFYDEVKALIATQNTALLKELLGELPEEIDMMHAKKAHSDAGAGNVIGHNHLLRKVKNLINSKLAAMGER